LMFAVDTEALWIGVHYLKLFWLELIEQPQYREFTKNQWLMI
jgi:hypothetical protein